MLYEVPELIDLINKTVDKKDWIYCERYMKVNNKKVEEKLPLEKKFIGNKNTYINGIVIKKSIITYILLHILCLTENVYLIMNLNTGQTEN